MVPQNLRQNSSPLFSPAFFANPAGTALAPAQLDTGRPHSILTVDANLVARLLTEMELFIRTTKLACSSVALRLRARLYD